MHSFIHIDLILMKHSRYTGAAEVNVLNDILGDSIGHDEFQEELENTEVKEPEGILRTLFRLLALFYP